MKHDLYVAAVEGFLGPFILAWAIVVSLVGGSWRVMYRLISAFVEPQPLPVGPGKTIRLP